MSNLTPHQLIAIDRYKARLEGITDLEDLRKRALNNYAQTLKMHNSYLAILTDLYQNPPPLKP